MDEELLPLIKRAQSVEELLTAAKIKGFEISKEEAIQLYRQVHDSGELQDDELDAVSGGGCKTKKEGHNYTIVTSGLTCFNGHYECGYKLEYVYSKGAGRVANVNEVFKKKDNYKLRRIWRVEDPERVGKCGNCYHLAFNGGIGYCDLT